MKFHLFMFTDAQRAYHMYHNHSVNHTDYLDSDPFLLLTHWCPLPVKLFEAALTLKLWWEAQKELALCQGYYLLILLILPISGAIFKPGVGVLFQLLVVEYSSYCCFISTCLCAANKSPLVSRLGFASSLSLCLRHCVRRVILSQ